MNYLIVGAGGQLATELERQSPSGAPDETRCLSVDQLDITDADQVHAIVDDLRPDVVFNAAAWTDVDGAETETARATAVNRDGPANLAAACAAGNARLVHVSTDFVFDGRRRSPYTTDCPTGPMGVYGATKLAGEQAVADRLGESALIVRTAWLYSPHGRNFVKTMVSLMRERDHLRVVADQRGTPTSAASLARALWSLTDRRLSGLHHWTDGGDATWHEFATAIHEAAHRRGLLPHEVRIDPITSEDWPTPAARPAYSVLDTSRTTEAVGYQPRDWREELTDVIEQLVHRAEREVSS